MRISLTVEARSAIKKTLARRGATELHEHENRTASLISIDQQQALYLDPSWKNNRRICPYSSTKTSVSEYDTMFGFLPIHFMLPPTRARR